MASQSQKISCFLQLSSSCGTWYLETIFPIARKFQNFMVSVRYGLCPLSQEVFGSSLKWLTWSFRSASIWSCYSGSLLLFFLMTVFLLGYYVATWLYKIWFAGPVNSHLYSQSVWLEPLYLPNRRYKESFPYYLYKLLNVQF